MKIIHNTASCNDYCTALPAVFYQQAETKLQILKHMSYLFFLYKMILVEGYQKAAKR